MYIHIIAPTSIDPCKERMSFYSDLFSKPQSINKCTFSHFLNIFIFLYHRNGFTLEPLAAHESSVK